MSSAASTSSAAASTSSLPASLATLLAGGASSSNHMSASSFPSTLGSFSVGSAFSTPSSPFRLGSAGLPFAPLLSAPASSAPFAVLPSAPSSAYTMSTAVATTNGLSPAVDAPPMLDLPGDMATDGSPGPFHFAHLVKVQLTSDNYLYWCAQLLPLLRSRHLEGFIDGSVPCPPATVQAIITSGVHVSAPNPAHRAWVAQDQAILTDLQSSLSPEVAGLVLFAASALDTWTTLAHSFASQSTARSMALRRQLQDERKLDQTATAFFNKVKALADTLTSIGQPLRDEEFASYVLAGLDQEYDSLAEAVIGARPPMTPRELYACLLSTEQRVESRRSVPVHLDSAAHAASRGGGGSRPPAPPAPRPPAPINNSNQGGRYGGQRPTCQLCGIVGHLASRCHRRFKRDFLGIGNDGRHNERQAAMATHGPAPGYTPSYPIDPT